MGARSQSHDRCPRGVGRIEAPEAALTAVITGRVQGVSYRYSTQRKAIELQLKGWVCNQADGSVALTAEGERANLEQLLHFLHQGPRFARVDEVVYSWVAPSDQFKRFQIVHGR